MDEANKIEVINRDGWRKDYPLHKGIIHIGSGPMNDIVLHEGLGVTALHAQLIAASQESSGYKLVNLADVDILLGLAGDRLLAPRAVLDLSDGQMFRLGEYTLVFRGNGVSTGRGARGGGSRYIGLSLAMPYTKLAPNQSLVGAIMVSNLGDKTGVTIELDLEGIDKECYDIAPGPLLAAGVSKDVYFRLHHRGAKPRAGEWRFTVRATAPRTYPGEQALVSQVIQVLPHYRHRTRLIPTAGIERVASQVEEAAALQPKTVVPPLTPPNHEPVPPVEDEEMWGSTAEPEPAALKMKAKPPGPHTPAASTTRFAVDQPEDALWSAHAEPPPPPPIQVSAPPGVENLWGDEAESAELADSRTEPAPEIKAPGPLPPQPALSARITIPALSNSKPTPPTPEPEITPDLPPSPPTPSPEIPPALQTPPLQPEPIIETTATTPITEVESVQVPVVLEPEPTPWEVAKQAASPGADDRSKTSASSQTQKWWQQLRQHLPFGKKTPVASTEVIEEVEPVVEVPQMTEPEPAPLEHSNPLTPVTTTLPERDASETTLIEEAEISIGEHSDLPPGEVEPATLSVTDSEVEGVSFSFPNWSLGTRKADATAGPEIESDAPSGGSDELASQPEAEGVFSFPRFAPTPSVGTRKPGMPADDANEMDWWSYELPVEETPSPQPVAEEPTILAGDEEDEVVEQSAGDETDKLDGNDEVSEEDELEGWSDDLGEETAEVPPQVIKLQAKPVPRVEYPAKQDTKQDAKQDAKQDVKQDAKQESEDWWSEG